MQRIQMTAADLSRTRVAAGPNALVEIALSVRGRSTSVAPHGADRYVELLAPLLQPGARVPTFLVPAQGTKGLSAGLAAVRRTDPDQIRADLAPLAAQRSLPKWASRLAAGDDVALARLVAALRGYFDVVLAPVWPALAAQVAVDRYERSQALLAGGYDGLFAGLRSLLRWRPPVLELDGPASPVEFELNGQGLLLVPSVFGAVGPFPPAGDRPSMLIYRISADGHWTPRHPGTALAALLGRTRAAVLLAVAAGCTTTELSRLVGVSLASASQHAAVLRGAGLVTTRRERSSVLHSLTPLGASLLLPYAPGAGQRQGRAS
jgi:hypothetical protein